MQTKIGQLQTNTSARGLVTFSLEIWHDGLKKHRTLRDGNLDVIKRKVQLQAEEWDERWSELATKREVHQQWYTEKQRQEQQRARANERATQAQSILESLQELLQTSLTMNDAVDWDSLKDDSPFATPRPVQPPIPDAPVKSMLPREPQRGDALYKPRLGFLDYLISSRRQYRISEAAALFSTEHATWAQSVQEIEEAYARAVKNHEQKSEVATKSHGEAVSSWIAKKDRYEKHQVAANLALDAKKAAYFAKDSVAITEYCDLVLTRSKYPDFIPRDFEIQYDEASRLLVLDYLLPAPEHLPTLKGVRYVATRDQFDEQHLSEAAAAKLYDEVLYQITLRTIHELFEGDVVDAIDVIVFNGIVKAVDRRTGKDVTACILSLRTTKTEFMEVNLSAVDPRACFKALKGVGSAKLVGLSPVAPIMPLNREDKRFVGAHAVAGTLDATVNLAAMDWEEFEHLIREIFAAEFSSTGGEVKVTQASRDGGVDAVAFDPDPIRGGKIVIQAKRYTNVVPVSAVRDLYGTVLNEGATKGVLVTTSDYGGDSYSFANGKPLVLLNGANLLHLLQKHGHQARIDLREARANFS